MEVVKYVIAAIVIVLTISGSVVTDEDDHWCHAHEEHMDAFNDVMTYLNVTTSGLKHADVNRLIDMVLFRVSCNVHEDEFINTTTCEMCLTADHIYKVLDLNTTDSLDESLFHKASTIIVVFAYQIDEKCSNPPDWDTVTYHDFAHELMEFHDHDHEHSHEEGEDHDADHEDGEDHDGDHEEEEDHDADHEHGEDHDAGHDEVEDHDGEDHDHGDHEEEEDHDADHEDGEDHDGDHEEEEDHDGDHEEEEDHDGDHDEEDHDEDHDEDHEDEEEHFFDFHQVESLLAELNETYRPGQYGIMDPDVETICSDEHHENFRARDIMANTETEHIEGIQESELGDMSANIIARILQGHCIRSDRAAVDDLPDEVDFVTALFSSYGDTASCTIDEHGIEEIMELLGITTDDHTDEHSEENNDDAHAHEEDTADDHAHDHRRKRDVASYVMPNQGHLRVKREDDDHDHDHEHSLLPNVSELCMSTHDLLRTFYLDAADVAVTRDDFIRLCPALLQQSIQGCRHVDEHDDHDHEEVSNLEKYGYGTAAAIIVSACAAFGLILGSVRNSPSYNYIMSVMLGLAMGSLVGDALLHLIPHALGLHDHSGDGGHDHDHGHGEGGITVEPFVWKMLAACGSVWVFFIMQLGLERLSGGHSHSHENIIPPKNVDGLYTKKSYENKGYEADVETDVNTGPPFSDVESSISEFTQHKATQALPWTVTIGDAIHNFADGLAIGAAFSQDWRSGISTSLAIFCHELPHEFGDVAMLMSAGWSVKKVALMQILSALTCLIGMYIGVSVAINDEVRNWIFIVTAGMFLYIALGDVVPEIIAMFRNDSSPVRIFFSANGGFLLGLGLLLIIAVFEESIAI